MNAKLTQNLYALVKLYGELADLQGHFYHVEATEYNVRLQGFLSSELEYKLIDMGFILDEDSVSFTRYIKGNIKINLEQQ